MNIHIPGIEVASIEPQPDFPILDISQGNAEVFQHLIDTEQRVRSSDSRDVDSQSSVYLEIICGSVDLHRRRAIGVESIELGSKLFDDMTMRLTGRVTDKLLVVDDGMDIVAKSLAKLSLSERAVNSMVFDFEQTMPNTARVVEMAAQGYDARLAKLGAVTSRSLVLSANPGRN